MKRNRFVLALATVVVVCLALVGCSGSGGGGDPTKAFLGTWELTEAPDLTSEDIDLMKALGIYCYVDLQDEGRAELNLMGEPLEGTWEAKSASECDITFEGETVTATLEDDLLSLDMDGEVMSFKKLSDEDATKLKEDAASALDWLAESEEGEDAGSSWGDDEEIVEEVNQQIVNDDTCTIEIVNKKTDWAGDSGYTLRITNNSASDISVDASWGTFSVNGTMADPVLSETIKPGCNVETFMWFGQSDVPDLASLVSVEGELEVYDANTYETIATYPFAA